MIQIGIDTSVLIGILDPEDIWHPRAVALKKSFTFVLQILLGCGMLLSNLGQIRYRY